MVRQLASSEKVLILGGWCKSVVGRVNLVTRGIEEERLMVTHCIPEVSETCNALYDID